jgi:uncharacterized membrane protein
LTRTDASTAALLLNLEGLATMGIAWILFHEPVDKRLLIGAGAILAGALLLSWQGDSAAFGWGALAIAGACVAWGFDNNLTRKLSSVDPVQIATVKGLVAGAVNVALAIVHGTTLPALSSLTGAGLVGLFGYGASLVLFVLALRYLGTARTAAYFSCAPFIGATLSVLMLQELITARLIIAGLLMAAGVYLHLSEAHEHEHAHEAVEHMSTGTSTTSTIGTFTKRLGCRTSRIHTAIATPGWFTGTRITRIRITGTGMKCENRIIMKCENRIIMKCENRIIMKKLVICGGSRFCLLRS